MTQSNTNTPVKTENREIEFTCPYCGQTYEMPYSPEESQMQCPSCGKLLAVEPPPSTDAESESEYEIEETIVVPPEVAAPAPTTKCKCCDLCQKIIQNIKPCYFLAFFGFLTLLFMLPITSYLINVLFENERYDFYVMMTLAFAPVMPFGFLAVLIMMNRTGNCCK